MENYDSILKEKKVYADPEPLIKKSRFTKYFVIDFLIIVIGLIICYIVYYCKILSPKNVILDDLGYFEKIAKVIVEPLQIDIDNDYSFNGTISFDQLNYKYNVVRHDKNMLLELTLGDENVHYYLDNNIMYANYSDFYPKDYIETYNTYKWINVYREYVANIGTMLDTDLQLKKNFYLDNANPVVEVDLVLNKDDINRLLGSTLILDDVGVSLTFKNNALTNNLLEGKLVINNKTKKVRNVIKFKNNEFIFTNNDGVSTRYLFQKTDKGFSIKVFNSDIQFSFLNGIKKEDGYEYKYQVIDEYYSLNLKVKNGDETLYNFSSSIGDDNGQLVEKKLSITRVDSEHGFENVNLSSRKIYSKLSDDEKVEYQKRYDLFILPIRDFINQYKDSVDYVDDDE